MKAPNIQAARSEIYESALLLLYFVVVIVVVLVVVVRVLSRLSLTVLFLSHHIHVIDCCNH